MYCSHELWQTFSMITASFSCSSVDLLSVHFVPYSRTKKLTKQLTLVASWVTGKFGGARRANGWSSGAQENGGITGKTNRCTGKETGTGTLIVSFRVKHSCLLPFFFFLAVQRWTFLTLCLSSMLYSVMSFGAWTIGETKLRFSCICWRSKNDLNAVTLGC